MHASSMPAATWPCPRAVPSPLPVPSLAHKPGRACLPHMTLAVLPCAMMLPAGAEWKPWEVPEGYEVEFLEEQQVEAKVGGAPK